MPSEYATATCQLSGRLQRRREGEAHTNVPPFGDQYPQCEEHEQRGGAGPSVGSEGRRLVEVGLEYLQRVSGR